MTNGTNTKRLVSTIGYQYFGKGADGQDKSLSVAYLENHISIGIFSLLPASQQTDRNKFDYKSGYTIYLKGKQAKTLSRLVKKAAKNILAGEEVEPSAISSAENLIEVANGTHYGMGEGVALAIYNKITPDKTCGEPATFLFSTEKLITNYNHKTGTYGEGLIDSDLDYFVDQLTEFAKGITNAKAHCIKKEFDFNMNRFASRQLEMCKALNINFDTPRSARNDWNNGSTYRNPIQSNSVHPVAEINTDELLRDIEGA